MGVGKSQGMRMLQLSVWLAVAIDNFGRCSDFEKTLYSSTTFWEGPAGLVRKMRIDGIVQVNNALPCFNFGERKIPM
eukprot:scaffold587_cov171-Amphora_coffeaeformis.AAC.13